MHDLEPGRRLRVMMALDAGATREREWFGLHRHAMADLAKVEFMEDDDVAAEDCATERVGGGTVCLPLSQAMDPKAEMQRLGKELDKQQAARKRVQGKLGNEQFLQRAPGEVVAKERL